MTPARTHPVCVNTWVRGLGCWALRTSEKCTTASRRPGTGRGCPTVRRPTKADCARSSTKPRHLRSATRRTQRQHSRLGARRSCPAKGQEEHPSRYRQQKRGPAPDPLGFQDASPVKLLQGDVPCRESRSTPEARPTANSVNMTGQRNIKGRASQGSTGTDSAQ